MKPLFFTLANNRHLMAIPDTEAHLDGHHIISYTYSLFIDEAEGDPEQALSKESTLHLEKINDPNYLGFVAFEKPANVFSYTSGDKQGLNVVELEEVVERLTHIRNNSQLWNPIDEI